MFKKDDNARKFKGNDEEVASENGEGEARVTVRATL